MFGMVESNVCLKLGHLMRYIIVFDREVANGHFVLSISIICELNLTQEKCKPY